MTAKSPKAKKPRPGVRTDPPPADVPLELRGGRPVPLVTASQVERLAMIQCTLSEAAACLHVAESTFKNWLGKAGQHRAEYVRPELAEAWARGQEAGRASLRRRQHRLAMAGHPTMLVWLGKQYLGQKDATEQSVTGDITIKVVRFGQQDDGEADEPVTIEHAPLDQAQR